MTEPAKPLWLHWTVAVAMLVLGVYPFVSGEHENRSLMWNSAAFVLILFGLLRVWMLMKGIPEARMRPGRRPHP